MPDFCSLIGLHVLACTIAPILYISTVTGAIIAAISVTTCLLTHGTQTFINIYINKKSAIIEGCFCVFLPHPPNTRLTVTQTCYSEVIPNQEIDGRFWTLIRKFPHREILMCKKRYYITVVHKTSSNFIISHKVSWN